MGLQYGAVTPSFYEPSDQGIYIIVTVSKSLTCIRIHVCMTVILEYIDPNYVFSVIAVSREPKPVNENKDT